MPEQPQSLPVIACLIRDDERYIIYFRPEQLQEAMHHVGRWADCPDLAFDWADARKISKSMIEESTEASQTNGTPE